MLCVCVWRDVLALKWWLAVECSAAGTESTGLQMRGQGHGCFTPLSLNPTGTTTYLSKEEGSYTHAHTHTHTQRHTRTHTHTHTRTHTHTQIHTHTHTHTHTHNQSGVHSTAAQTVTRSCQCTRAPHLPLAPGEAALSTALIRFTDERYHVVLLVVCLFILLQCLFSATHT